jgi:hypothetical protein
MPPKMKLANVNFAISSNSLPRLSQKSKFGCIGFNLFLSRVSGYLIERHRNAVAISPCLYCTIIKQGYAS